MEKLPLADILRPESVAVDLAATDRRDVLVRLIALLPLDGSAEREEVLRAVLAREEIQTTGIGYGIAIPHGKAPIGPPIVAAVGITREPVPWDSVDSEPVRILVLMVSRPDVTGPHVHALAQAARLLGRKDFRAALLECATPEAVVDLIRSREGAATP